MSLNRFFCPTSCVPSSSPQGLMFGYATDETEECMPLTILLAHKLNYRLKELSRNGECPWILPDSKSQVSLLRRTLLWFLSNKEAPRILLHPHLTVRCEFDFSFSALCCRSQWSTKTTWEPWSRCVFTLWSSQSSTSQKSAWRRSDTI